MEYSIADRLAFIQVCDQAISLYQNKKNRAMTKTMCEDNPKSNEELDAAREIAYYSSLKESIINELVMDPNFREYANQVLPREEEYKPSL